MMQNLYASSKRLSMVLKKLPGLGITTLTNIYNNKVSQKVLQIEIYIQRLKMINYWLLLFMLMISSLVAIKNP